VFAAACALALRCLTESVMVDFYVWPALAVGLVVAAGVGRWRLAIATVAAVFTTAAAQWRLGWLPWWAIVTAGLVVVLAVGTRRGRGSITEDTCALSVPSRGREPPRVLVGAVS
jgi:hypothetical protein